MAAAAKQSLSQLRCQLPIHKGAFEKCLAFPFPQRTCPSEKGALGSKSRQIFAVRWAAAKGLQRQCLLRTRRDGNGKRMRRNIGPRGKAKAIPLKPPRRFFLFLSPYKKRSRRDAKHNPSVKTFGFDTSLCTREAWTPHPVSLRSTTFPSRGRLGCPLLTRGSRPQGEGFGAAATFSLFPRSPSLFTFHTLSVGGNFL